MNPLGILLTLSIIFNSIRLFKVGLGVGKEWAYNRLITKGLVLGNLFHQFLSNSDLVINVLLLQIW